MISDTTSSQSSTQIFGEVESQVRSYCRAFPKVFNRAKGSLLYTEGGEQYIDFLAGAGGLNYGHNPDPIKQRLMDYLASDSIAHGLDFYTTAKRDFLTTLHQRVLKPKGYDYKVQFPGPTGTNAVEAALKLARKVKGRSNIFAFMGGYHGMTLGALAATGNSGHRVGSGVPLTNVTFMPYPHGFMKTFDTIEYMEQVLTDDNSGIDKPAAIILETIQAEGGVIVAPVEWLQRLRALCDRHDILMIVDDIQVGCGRIGPFFSFERAGIVPDMVTLSKSISGYGLPLALVLIRPDLDIWKPAEHNGTFRGNQMAFVAGAAALVYRDEIDLEKQVAEKSNWLASFLQRKVCSLDKRLEIRGMGLFWGIDCSGLNAPDIGVAVGRLCFERGLIIERAGRNDMVLKVMPPLNIEPDLLERGCNILAAAFQEVLGKSGK